MVNDMTKYTIYVAGGREFTVYADFAVVEEGGACIMYNKGKDGNTLVAVVPAATLLVTAEKQELINADSTL